jgi:hypothetical protein
MKPHDSGPTWSSPWRLSRLRVGGALLAVVLLAAVGLRAAGRREAELAAADASQHADLLARADHAIARVLERLSDNGDLAALEARRARQRLLREAAMPCATAAAAAAADMPAPSECAEAPGERNGAGVAEAIPTPDEPPPTVVLTGIIWHTDRPLAIVSGRMVGRGDVVGGWRVSRVEEDRVVLARKSCEHDVLLHREKDHEREEAGD